MSDKHLADLRECKSSRDIAGFLNANHSTAGRVDRAGLAVCAADVLMGHGLPREQQMLKRMRIAGCLGDAVDITAANDVFEYGPCERLACALSVLNFHYEPVEGAYARAQRVVNDILLDNPNLLHPRFVVPHLQPASMGQFSWRTVMMSLATSREGMLPCVLAGVPAERVEKFAESSALWCAMVNNAPKTASVFGVADSKVKVSMGLMRPLDGALQEQGVTRPRLLASMLELGRTKALAKRQNWPTHKHNMNRSAAILRSMTTAVWTFTGQDKRGDDTRTATGQHDYQPFLDEFKRSGALELDDIRMELVHTAARSILGNWVTIVGAQTVSASTPATARANTRAAMQTLMRLEIADSELAAARWLYDEFLGEGRPNHRPLPEVTVDAAMGFFQSLIDTGLQLPPMPPQERTGAARPLIGTREKWLQAHQVFASQQLMQRAIDATQAETTTTSDQAGRRRLRHL